jgi:cytochrome P450
MGLPWDELDTFLHLRDGILRPDKLDPNAMFDADARLAVQRATGRDIYAYFDRVCDEREQHPTDDILTHLVTVDVEGEKLTREEIQDICFLFLIAGLDTVSDSLTCFYAFLANNPDHRRQLVDDPVDHSRRGGGGALGVADCRAVSLASRRRTPTLNGAPFRPARRSW